jgi:hypothetical protein
MNTTPQEFCRKVPDPNDRKRSAWQVSFKQGASGHIIDKHVKNPGEPWSAILPPEYYKQLKTLPGSARQDDDHHQLKYLLLELAHQSCKRPQVMMFQERQRSSPGASSVRLAVKCGLLVCHCGLLIVVRQEPATPQAQHKITTAFFPRDSLSRARGKPVWTKVVADLIRDYCPAGDGGRVLYPAPEVTRIVRDESRTDRELERSHIEFITMHTWNFQPVHGQTIHCFSYPDWNPAPLRMAVDTQTDGSAR